MAPTTKRSKIKIPTGPKGAVLNIAVLAFTSGQDRVVLQRDTRTQQAAPEGTPGLGQG